MKPSKQELKDILDSMRAQSTNPDKPEKGESRESNERKMRQQIAEKQAEMADALDVEGQEHVKIAIPEELARSPMDEDRVRRVPGGIFGESEEGSPPEKPDIWMRKVPELGTVRVSEPEYEAFFRNYLLGVRQVVRTKIQVTPGVYFCCKVQALTPSEREVLAIAVSKIVKHSILLQELEDSRDVKQVLKTDAWMKLEALVRIVSIEDQPWEHFKIDLGSDMLPEEYPDYDKLVRASKLRFNNSHNFTLIFRSLHQAAVKFTIMEDALANRDFTDPAGADSI